MTFTIWEGASVNSDARAQASKIDFGHSKTKTDSQKSDEKKNRGDSKNKVGSAVISLVAKNQQLTPDSNEKLSRCWACGDRIFKQDPKSPTKAGKDARKAYNESRATWKKLTPTQREAAVKALSKATIKRVKKAEFLTKPRSKKKESKSKDKKKNKEQADTDGNNSDEASINGTMVNKDEFDKKHNKTTERDQKEKQDAREQEMVAKLNEAELQKKTPQPDPPKLHIKS